MNMEFHFKSNCIQGTTEGKTFQVLIPSFGLKEHCHGYKQSFGTTGFRTLGRKIIMQMKPMDLFMQDTPKLTSEVTPQSIYVE